MSKKNKQLIVLAQSLEQPRIVKRIVEKSAEFETVVVYGFNRNIHKVNNYDLLNKYDNVSVKEVATLSNQKYGSRIWSYIRLIFTLYKNHGLKFKHIYVFGIDLRIICLFVANSKIEYEISDIMWLYKSKFQKKVLKSIDGFLVKNSDKVIFTSLGFYNSYYRQYISDSKIEVKENKFKTYGKVLPVDSIIKDKIRIAYIGAFRYTNIVKNLIDTVNENKNIVLNFYGDGAKSVVNLIEKNTKLNKNIFYHGSFKNPDDLEHIYSNNNLNFVVYNNELFNERVAMPNKYYESGYFNIPIVCAENTYVGERVLENKMGWTIGIQLDQIKDFVEKLKIEELIEHHNNIKKLDKTLFEV